MVLSQMSSADEVSGAARQAIEAAIPGAKVEVTPSSPGHYEISVTSSVFAGKSKVQQQQLVYRAIFDLMRGEGAPIHAIDRLQTIVG
jgi:acid stress-induced BolA-like protein IbaG/YrbA